jgi:hypothetical protein
VKRQQFLVLKVHKVLLDQLVHKDRKVLKDHKVQLVLQVHKVHKDQLDHKVQLAQLVNWVRKVQLVLLLVLISKSSITALVLQLVAQI